MNLLIGGREKLFPSILAGPCLGIIAVVAFCDIVCRLGPEHKIPEQSLRMRRSGIEREIMSRVLV